MPAGRLASQHCSRRARIIPTDKAVLASPVSLWAKIPGLLVGWICLPVINFLRLVSLFIIGISFPAFFDVVHEHIWQAVFVVLAIVFRAIWVQLATRSDRGSSDVSG